MLSAQYIIEENAKMNGIRFLFDEENSCWDRPVHSYNQHERTRRNMECI